MKILKNRRRLLVLTAGIAFAVILTLSLPSLANIMLAPKRVVFEGRTRSATVAVLNTSRERRSFELGWKMVTADEEGKPVNATMAQGPHSVSKMVVFSPRRVTIEPNGRQSVRLSLRRPADLPPGEYRGHLVFSSNPEEDQEIRTSAGKGVALALKINLGMSIPIIVRQGDVAPEGLDIQNIHISSNPNGAQTIELSLVRTPNKGASAYGNIRIYNTVAGGKERLVATSPNVSVYVEQPKRIVRVPLRENIPAGSKLRIVYEGGEEYSGTVLAQKSIDVK